MSKKTALVLLSRGSEEMEFVIAADVLRRAGVDVTVAGVQGSNVHECSRKIKIEPDVALDEVLDKTVNDAVVLPGGLGGSKVLAETKTVGVLLKKYEAAGKLIAGICAAPTAFKAHNIGIGSKVTSHPSVEKELMLDNQYTYLNDRVVVDGKLITSRGPGTAFEFALAIVKELLGEEAMTKLKADMLLKE